MHFSWNIKTDERRDKGGLWMYTTNKVFCFALFRMCKCDRSLQHKLFVSCSVFRLKVMICFHLWAHVPCSHSIPTFRALGRQLSRWWHCWNGPLGQVLADVFLLIGAGQQIPESSWNPGCYGNTALLVTCDIAGWRQTSFVVIRLAILNGRLG